MVTSKTLSISSLPDYAALEQLASALWALAPSKGAAVFVGAGFSRNAELAGEDTPPPPRWRDLHDAMAQELYKDRWQEAPADSLRLADEFRIYFGQTALTEFLHKQIADVSWKPGELHRVLMALPWSEILTTNYDTLLERASYKHRAVRDESDLGQIRGARVIKLHGSIDSNTHLILSEDDFRTYPVKHAAFVNTARQIFLENELCLLGFSGDDPNFLQWSGWVRDHLGDKARRIYLVGCLNLSAAKRRLLESRGVAPIDFAPLLTDATKEDQDRRCCELFLSYLESKKPISAVDWKPSDHKSYDVFQTDPAQAQKEMQDPAFARRVLSEILVLWKKDFENCPPWLVTPKKTRDLIESGTRRAPLGYPHLLTLAQENIRAEFLKLLLWRQTVALKEFDTCFEEDLLTLVDKPDVFLAKERVWILIKLLAEARYRRDASAFARIEKTLEEAATVGSDAYAALVAERLRWARDGLEFDVLEKEIDNLKGPSPIWSLVKAALFFESGNESTGEALLRTSREDMADRARRDRTSTSAASRFAWANLFVTSADLSATWAFQSHKADEELSSGYDVQNEIDLLSLDIRERRLRRVEQPSGFQPAFGAGRFKDHSRTIRFVGGYKGEEAETVFRLIDEACGPLKLGNADILSSTARDALDLEPLHTLNWYLRLIRAISQTSSPLLEKYFSDINIAKMAPEVASELFDRVLSAARFWKRKVDWTASSFSHSNVELLRKLIEILSRLVVRSDTDKSISAFRFALEATVFPKAVYPWLYEPLEHLLNRSLLSLSRETRANLVLECLEFPLPEDLPDTALHWPNPAGWLFSHSVKPDRGEGDNRWRAAVARLLSAAKSIGRVRSDAVHRLAYLSAFNGLDPDERTAFGDVIWLTDRLKADGLPNDVDLYPHVTATLPAPSNVDPYRVVNHALFGAPFEPATVDTRLRSIVAAAKASTPIPRMAPQREEALWLLDELPSLMPKLGATGDPFKEHMNQDRIHFVGEVVGRAVLPQLMPEDISLPRLNFIFALGRLGCGGGALAGWHELARLSPGTAPKIVADLRRAIRRGNLYDTAGAAYALGTWAAKLKDARYCPIPDVLKDSLLASLEARSYESLQVRLWATRQLFRHDALSEQQIVGLTESLRDLSSDLAYEAMPFEGSEAVGVTAARGEFVRLVRDFLEAGRSSPTEAFWVIGAPHDPLPEVRFADDNIE